MNEFFNMGGYAFYIWLSYALFAVVFIANILIPWKRERTLLQQLARKARRKQNELHHHDAEA